MKRKNNNPHQLWNIGHSHLVNCSLLHLLALDVGDPMGICYKNNSNISVKRITTDYTLIIKFYFNNSNLFGPSACIFSILCMQEKNKPTLKCKLFDDTSCLRINHGKTSFTDRKRSVRWHAEPLNCKMLPSSFPLSYKYT